MSGVKRASGWPREIIEWWDAGLSWSDIGLVALLKSLGMTRRRWPR